MWGAWAVADQQKSLLSTWWTFPAVVPSAIPWHHASPHQTPAGDVWDPGTATNSTDVVPGLKDCVDRRGWRREQTLLEVLQALTSVPPPLGDNTTILADSPTNCSQLSSLGEPQFPHLGCGDKKRQAGP